VQNFIKTIINSVQSWTKKQIKDSTADWNQNDSNADSYVKNRTHWEETKETVLVDNLTFDEYDNGNAPQCNFVPNQVYTVVWNGKKYENLVCYFDGDYNIIADPNLGCPFYIDDDGGDDLYIESYEDNTDWTVSIFTTQTVVHKLDPKYLNLPTNLATTDDVQSAKQEAMDVANTAQTTADGKMDATNPVGTGSFSMNRMANSKIGSFSTTIGESTIANVDHSFARGKYNIQIPIEISEEWVSETREFVKDSVVYAATAYTFDETTGLFQLTGSMQSYSIKNFALAGTTSYFIVGATSGTEICKSVPDITIKATLNRVTGKYAILGGKWLHRSVKEGYVEVVGNGTSDTERSNAHTLDWEGNAWYSGDVYVGSTSGTDKDEGSKKLATEEFVSSKIAEAELGGEEVDLSGYALKSELPSRVSQLQNDSGYITGYTETDPTVPAWAKAASKPTYTASEVGARPSNWMPTAADVGADSEGTASSVVSAHSTATDAHNDIRLALKDINDRLNAFFDSDDKTLDELSEIVTYITSNKALIDSITTSKVSVADIINNLTTNVTNKPLSAAQGVALKTLIDNLNAADVGALPSTTVIPDALADLKADSNHRVVTDAEKTAWNAKANTSDIPTKVSELTNDSGFLTGYTETDPTVPSWAKASTKPSYTKSEVGLGNVDNVKQYSASNPPPYPVTSVNGKTGAVNLDASAVGALPSSTTIPTKVSQLTNDKGYLTQHQDISGKLDASALPTAINTALAQAKASGEFDGKDGANGTSVTHSWNGTTLTITSASGISSANLKGDTGATGQRGTGLLAVTTAPSSYTTAVGGITPKYRMAISTIKTQAGVTEVLLGDTVRYSYYHYPIDYLDASYAYFTERVSIRGATGAAGTSPTVDVSKSGKVTTINITDAEGTKTATINDGEDGASSTANYIGKKILFMGDSITRQSSPTSGWVGIFNTMLQPSNFVNTAVVGAGWVETDTTVYDGNPTQTSNNVIGNQIEKIARGKDTSNPNYSAVADYAHFDIIIIAAGINDYSIKTDEPDIEASFTSGSSVVALSALDRKVFASAFRYNVERIKKLYPTAQLFICTPTQVALGARTYKSVKEKRDHIIALCERMSLTYIDTFMCGIYSVNEVNGGGGLHLNDGVHPNDAGKAVIANYNAREVIKHYIGGNASVPEATYTNRVPTSINADGTVFNGVGYQNDVRIGSSGTLSTSGAAESTATGFIKVSGGDVIRVSGGKFNNTGSGNANAIGVYSSSFGHLGTSSLGGTTNGIFGSGYSSYAINSVVEETTGVYKWVVPPIASGVEYIRVSCWGGTGVAPGANLIVTVNQEIT
jgi:lysophospholipase L1-like esterase